MPFLTAKYVCSLQRSRPTAKMIFILHALKLCSKHGDNSIMLPKRFFKSRICCRCAALPSPFSFCSPTTPEAVAADGSDCAMLFANSSAAFFIFACA